MTAFNSKGKYEKLAVIVPIPQITQYLVILLSLHIKTFVWLCARFRRPRGSLS